MINITKQGNNVIVTSDNPNSFNISNSISSLFMLLPTLFYSYIIIVSNLLKTLN